ncbi:Uncharacterized protein HZ326_19121 [Fusarium oxysporum f. sp. albedinis]|nr:Uncharacterized protein HZ326_19121 [Fusarium oxysporum f. sp. albedinis]
MNEPGGRLVLNPGPASSYLIASEGWLESSNLASVDYMDNHSQVTVTFRGYKEKMYIRICLARTSSAKPFF